MFEKRQDTNEGGNFVPLKNQGDEVKGVLAGTPIRFLQHWVNKQPSVCTKQPNCPGCASGRPKKMFRCNFIMKEGDGYVAKILEKGMSVYDALETISSEYELKKTALKISRSGSGMETTYNVLPLPPSEQPTAAALAKIAAVPLLDLDPNRDAVAGDFAPQQGAVPF